MKRAPAVALALAALAACTEAPPQTPALAERYLIDVRSPASLPYTPSLLGTGPHPVAVVVDNRSDEPLDVTNLRLRLDVVQGSFTRRCESGGGPRSTDPTVLRPGQSHAFQRDVDCRLPLAGRYGVLVSTAFGSGERPWHAVRSYSLDVVAPPSLAPRAIDDGGLYASIGGAPVAGPASGLEHPRVAIALTNSGAVPLEVPAMNVETRVRRHDASFRCISKAVALGVPPALAVGATHVEPFDVTCLGLDVPGAYDIEILLHVGDREIALGQVRIEVRDDPARLRAIP